MSDKELRAMLLKPLDEIRAKQKTAQTAPSSMRTTDKPKMTLTQYVSNPTGKGSNYVANRSMIRQGLNMKYISLLREYRKNFYAVPYIYPNGDILYWVKVPSEYYKDNKISYDVCILLEYSDTQRRAMRNVRFYSNSPSFIYTYCYAYNVHDLLIERLKSRLPQEALTKPAVVRNPINSLGYETSTYIAARYLLDGMCLSDNYVNRYGRNMNAAVEAGLVAKIADPELLVQIYQHTEYMKRKNHRKELTAEQRKKRNEQRAKYAASQKGIVPKSNFIVHRSPRSKITARKARRSIMNERKR